VEFRLQRTVRVMTAAGTRQRRRVARILEEPPPEERLALSSSCGGNMVELTPDFDEFFASLIAHGVSSS